MHYPIILDARTDCGYTARFFELSPTLGHASTQGEALCCICEYVELVHDARCEVLQKTIGAVNSEIIRIEVTDAA
jgi:hypothetical protein